MTDFIDPSDFDSEAELFDYIVENLIKPKLRETLGEEGDIEQVSGLVYVFGGRGGVEPDVIERIQKLVTGGMDLDYVLREMTDLAVQETKEARYGDLIVRYVELARDDDDTEPVSTADLELMFGGQPSDPGPDAPAGLEAHIGEVEDDPMFDDTEATDSSDDEDDTDTQEWGRGETDHL